MEAIGTPVLSTATAMMLKLDLACCLLVFVVSARLTGMLHLPSCGSSGGGGGNDIVQTFRCSSLHYHPYQVKLKPLQAALVLLSLA
jgi:hypothetical protein